MHFKVSDTNGGKKSFTCIIRNDLLKFADQFMGSVDVRSIAQSMYPEGRKVYPV